jgi:hypothetical protein
MMNIFIAIVVVLLIFILIFIYRRKFVEIEVGGNIYKVLSRFDDKIAAEKLNELNNFGINLMRALKKYGKLKLCQKPHWNVNNLPQDENDDKNIPNGSGKGYDGCPVGVGFNEYTYFVRNLLYRYDPTVLRESEPIGEDTSFVINKGDDFAMCLRDWPHDQRTGEKTTDINEIMKIAKMHDDSLLKFVFMHELTHVGCETYDHGDEFWTNFGWLLHFAEKHDLYTPINYRENPVMYCGMVNVTHNPYFDN